MKTGKEGLYGKSFYQNYNFNVEKSILKDCCQEFFELFLFIFELRGDWRRRGEDIEELGVRRDDRTLFAPTIQVHMYSRHIQITPFISSAEQIP